jgi:Na+/citrate or Na+/malate symporter
VEYVPSKTLNLLSPEHDLSLDIDKSKQKKKLFEFSFPKLLK